MLDAEELERYRSYLRLLARQQIGPRYRAKIDSSGVIQETLLAISAAADRFELLPEEDRTRYARRILANKLVDQVRRFGRNKRSVCQEVSLQGSLHDSSMQLERTIAANDALPPDQLAGVEQLSELAAAIAQLPEDQQLAIELHYLEGLTLKDTAKELGRTMASVAGLVRRGLASLRLTLRELE